MWVGGDYVQSARKIQRGPARTYDSSPDDGDATNWLTQ
jgi:hypothetical protein